VHVHPFDLLLNDVRDASRLSTLHATFPIKRLCERRFTKELLNDRFAVPREDKPVTRPDEGHIFGLFAKERRLEAAGLKHREQ
jgi:hypothetical protein